MGRSRGGQVFGPPGKSQVAIGFLRNSGMDLPGEAFATEVVCKALWEIC